MSFKLFVNCYLLTSAIALVGQEFPPNARTPVEPPSIEQSKVQSPDELPIKEVSPGIFELANVRLDQKNEPSHSRPTSTCMKVLLSTSW